jgi:hypothetical protein
LLIPRVIAEGPITLGSGYANQVRIFSAAGVQIGDTLLYLLDLVLFLGVPTNHIGYRLLSPIQLYRFFATEGPITTEVAVYSMAKSMIYMESDQNLTITLNGGSPGPTIVPTVANGSIYPGSFSFKWKCLIAYPLPITLSMSPT